MAVVQSIQIKQVKDVRIYIVLIDGIVVGSVRVINIIMFFLSL